LSDLFSNIKQVKKATVILFTILFIVTIAVQSTYLAGTHFEDASEFYHFIREDEVQALNWIKENTPPNATFATSGYPEDVGGGGNSYAWWVEGYSNRICMFTGDLDFYSFQFERDEVRTANNIFAGTYVIDNGYVKVAESFPAGINNPQILGFMDDKYEKLLTLSDFRHQLFLTSVEDPESMLLASFYSENSTSTINCSESMANITVTYDLPLFEATRSVIIYKDASFVDVSYRVVPINSNIKELRINLWGLSETPTANCNISNNAVVTLSQGSDRDDVTTVINIMEKNGKLEGARVFFEDPEVFWPTVNYVFKPTQNDLFVHFKISVNTPISEAKSQTVKMYDSYNLLKDLNIEYIMLNIDRDNEYRRFLADSDHFKVEFQNKGVIIFKVSQ
jgi:hypothetical protein